MRRFFVGLAILVIAVLIPLVGHANDRQIAEQIVKKLQQQKDQGNLQHFNIDMQVDHGAVYLRGHVASPEQERLALDAARRVEGVRQVFNEIKVRPAKPSKSSTPSGQLRREPRSLQQHSAQSPPRPTSLTSAIATQVQSVLAGRNETTSGPEREPLSQETAALPQRTTGQNQAAAGTGTKNLAVSSSAAVSNKADQSREIAEEIIDKLREEQRQGNLRDFGIDVEVDDGVVWLKGRVSTAQQQQLALNIARHAQGVKRVVNALTVSVPSAADGQAAPKSENPSAALDRGVQHAFRKTNSDSESSRRQQASSDESLLGLTESPRGLAAPLRQAAPPRIDATDIAREVVSRLQRQKEQGNLKDFAIDVRVDEDIVWMSGHVSTPDQLELALDMARHVPGVKKVVNDLAVAADQELRPPSDKAPTQAVSASNPAGQQAPASTLAQRPTPAAPRPEPNSPASEAIEEGQQETGHESAAPEDRTRQLVGAESSPVPLNVAARLAALAQETSPVAAAQTEPQARTDQEPQPTKDPRPSAGLVPAVEDQPSFAAAGGQQQTPGLLPQAPAQGQQYAVPLWQYGLVPVQYVPVPQSQAVQQLQTPLAFAPARPVSHSQAAPGLIRADSPAPVPMTAGGVGIAPARFDHPQLPGYAWPSYAPYPNYGAVTYPKQYSPSAWPYIGPFYPYPQVPLGWRKVTLEWDDGWWHLDFKDRH